MSSNGCHTNQIKVCVVGAGVCGLVATKICLENGLQVTCFDRSSKYGGLWHYRPDTVDPDGPFEPSVMKTTIMNTTKENSSFSDFPPSAHLPNFMRHDQYMDYIESYVQHFGIKQHLKLEHEILKCWPEWREPGAENPAPHIKWLVQARHLRTSESFLYEFDRLMVAVGHHNIPFAPTYENQDQFKGEILHSARLKDILANKKFANKRVLVVGLGNSACDAANDIAQVAKTCYLSCHRGQWLYGRQLRLNPPNRLEQYMLRLLPVSWIDKFVIKQCDKRVEHDFLGLKPNHKPSQLTPSINDLLAYRILTGSIVLKNSITTFTESGVRFEGEEEEEYPIDVAVLATGYETKAIFMDELQLGIKSAEHNNEYDLFLNIFAPNFTLPSRTSSHDIDPEPSEDCRSKLKPDRASKRAPLAAIKSLAYVGLVQPAGSITVVCEMQSRYACLVFKGQRELPDVKAMLKSIGQMRKMRARSIRSHSRDQLVGSHLSYMETVASLAGVMPNIRGLFFSDYTLWKRLMFGPSVPYQYRLVGPGSWPEARQTILTAQERIETGINQGKNRILYSVRRRRLRDNNGRGRAGKGKNSNDKSD